MISLEKSIHILKHSLGLTYEKEPYRRHFCVSAGSDDEKLVKDLIESGHMVLCAPSSILPPKAYYAAVTEKGLKSVYNGKKTIQAIDK